MRRMYEVLYITTSGTQEKAMIPAEDFSDVLVSLYARGLLKKIQKIIYIAPR